MGHHLRPIHTFICVSTQVFSCQQVSMSTLTIHKDTEEFSFMTSRPGDLFILNCSIISSLFFIHFFPRLKSFIHPVMNK